MDMNEQQQHHHHLLKDNADEASLSFENPAVAAATVLKIQQQQQQGQPEKETLSVVPRRQQQQLDPVIAFEEWKSQHSVQALQNDRNHLLQDRKFIVANFGCPMQLGIQSTDFVDSLLIAIATNRTLLFRYGGIFKWIKEGQNSYENCTRILQPADWMPVYEDYQHLLVDDDGEQHEIYQIERETFSDRDKQKVLHTNVDRGERVHSDISEHVVVQMPRLWTLAPSTGAWQGLTDLRNKYASAYISEMFGLPPLQLQEHVRKLYREDIYFLYGMLFWRSFSLTDELIESVSESIIPTNSSFFSIAVHSRHASISDDGTNVDSELNCIHQFLDKFNTEGKPCQTFLMSDRPVTVEAITERVQAETSCSVHHVQEYKRFAVGNGNTEHGKFAGAGFLQDLYIVGVARDGFVRRRRSSTSFVASYMEYHRRMDDWNASGTRQSPRMHECTEHMDIEPQPDIF